MLLSDLAQGRDNNLNLLRMCAAFGVLISHSYVITGGPETVEPLKEATGITLGTICVVVFFIISGFLVTQSLDRSSHVANWIAARCLRLFPGLVVVLALTVFVLGPAVTVLPPHEYFGNAAVFTYIPRNLTLVSLQFELPGVFQDNPYGAVINGSLWSLFYEVVCYCGVLVAGLIGLVRSPQLLSWMIVLFLAGNTLLHAFGWQKQLPYEFSILLHLAYPFAIGMLTFSLRRVLPLAWPVGIALIVLPVLTYGTVVYFLAFTLCLAYWVFLVSYLLSGPIRAYNQIGDYSYGVYIYAFPMQQLIVFLFGPMIPGQNVLLATPATLLLAVLSWHLIEKPALTLKNRVAVALVGIIPGRIKAPDERNR